MAGNSLIQAIYYFITKRYVLRTTHFVGNQ